MGVNAIIIMDEREFVREKFAADAERVGDGIQTRDFQSHSLNAPERKPLPDNTSGTPDPSLAPVLAPDPEDPDLVRVVTAWPALPPHLRAAVLALVDAAKT